MPRRRPSHEDDPGVRRSRWLFRRKPKQSTSEFDRLGSKTAENALDSELRKRAFSDPQSFT